MYNKKINKKIVKRVVVATLTMAFSVGTILGVNSISSKAASKDNPRFYNAKAWVAPTESAPGVPHVWVEGGPLQTERGGAVDIDGYRYSITSTGIICEKRTKLINDACSKIGLEYQMGFNGPNAYDCSGLVHELYKAVGANISRQSTALRGDGEPVNYKADWANVMEGDILCFNGHVAIYIGMNQMVHARNEKYGIVWDEIKPGNEWYKKLVAVRHVGLSEMGGCIFR